MPVGEIAKEFETCYESQSLPGVIRCYQTLLGNGAGGVVTRLIGNDHQHRTSSTASMIKHSERRVHHDRDT